MRVAAINVEESIKHGRRIYYPTFTGFYRPGMSMYVMSGGAKAYIPQPTDGRTPIKGGLNYLA